MKNNLKGLMTITMIFLFAITLTGCGKEERTDNKLDCKINSSLKGTMEGDQIIFTFENGYATEQEVSTEFDTKEEAKEAYDSLGEGTTTKLDGKRIYYIRKPKETEKFTREEVKQKLEAQGYTCK